jgi:hypothetical protein
MKLKFVLALLLPLAEAAVTLLRTKDENSTGWDDIAATQLEAAIESLKQYVAS